MLFSILLLSTAASPLETQAEDLLRRALPARFSMVDVTTPDALKGKLLSARFVRPPRAGTNTVELTLLRGTETARRWGFARLQEQRRVLAARRNLPTGHTVTAGDLGFVMSSHADGMSLDPRAFVGKTLLASLSASQVVTAEHLDRPIPQPRGTPVAVLSRTGAVEVRTKGALAQAGAPGARARVLLEGQRRPLSGTLIDASTFVLDRGISP